MDLTFISYCFPPLKYPRAVQVARLAKYTSFPVEVYCGAEDPWVDDSLNRLIAHCTVRPIPKDRLNQRLDKIRHRLPFWFSLPDGYRDWAYKCARLYQPREKSVLVTFGNPMSDHLAGLNIKKRFPEQKWVAHFSDPWADNPYQSYGKFTSALMNHWERKVIESADLVIFTSKETESLVMRKYPGQRSFVLPHAYDPELVQASTLNKDHFRVVTIGNFYGKRTPNAFVKAVEGLKLNDVQFDVFGHIQSPLHSERITWKGKIDYLDSLQCLQNADLLVLIDGDFEFNPLFPSKLSEYIGTGKPILGITPPGTSSRIIQSLGGWVVSPQDEAGIQKTLLQAITDVRELRVHDYSEIRLQYAAPIVAKCFDERVKELLN